MLVLWTITLIYQYQAYFLTKNTEECSGKKWSDAFGCHVVEPDLDFNKILTSQKNSKILPLSTKHKTTEWETDWLKKQPKKNQLKQRNGAVMSWWHVIIGPSFLKNITAFFLFSCFSSFAVFAVEHITVGFVFFHVPSAVKLKQVWIANNAAKLTTPARWVHHHMANESLPVASTQLVLCMLCIFSYMGVNPLVSLHVMDTSESQ